MATASLTADKYVVTVGQQVTFRPTLIGLTQPTSRTDMGHVDVLLNDGTTVSADSAAVTITKPGQSVVSTSVTFQGKTLTANTDGTYTATAS
jgi:hypothetical protein